jgi:hypothetical protein
LCCCIHVAFLYSFVVLVLEELCFGDTPSCNLTLVENGVFADGVGEAVRDELSHGIDYEYSERDTESKGPLLPREGFNLEDEVGELDDDDLEAEDNGPHSEEHEVVEEASEDVPLVMDLARADHVHNLHEHEQVEEEGEVLGEATWEHEVRLIGTAKLSSEGIVLLGVQKLSAGDDIVSPDGRATLPVLEERGAIPVLCAAGVDPGTILRPVESSEYIGLKDEVLSEERDDNEDDGLPDGAVLDVLDHAS